MRWFSVFAAGAVSLSTAAVAQTDAEMDRMLRSFEGTLYTAPHRSSTDGSLNGCGIEFAAITRDFSTGGGAYVRIDGSVYVRSHPSAGLAYLLKLGVFDDLTSDKGWAPVGAFFSSPSSDAPPTPKRTVSDNPSYALFVGAAGKEVLAALASIVDDRRLMVGFNRKQGQQDVVTELDLAVTDISQAGGQIIRKKDDTTVPQFAACMRALTEKALKQFQK